MNGFRFSYHNVDLDIIKKNLDDNRKKIDEINRILSNESSLIFICGHYKGIDQRIRDSIITEEISIGDFVLTGGELPTMIMIDSIVRLKRWCFK